MAPSVIAEGQVIDSIMATPGSCRFGPWIVYWTGWKEYPHSIAVCGQWVAVHQESKPELWHVEERKLAYSSYPGAVGWAWPTDVLNVDRFTGQLVVTGISSCIVKESCRRLALEKLLIFLLEEGLHPTLKTVNGAEPTSRSCA